MSKLSNNECIALIEIHNVLELYREGNIEEINKLLECSYDLPTGNFNEDTKTLINLILKHNFIENKVDIIQKSKYLTEVLGLATKVGAKVLGKLGAGKIASKVWSGAKAVGRGLNYISTPLIVADAASSLMKGDPKPESKPESKPELNMYEKIRNSTAAKVATDTAVIAGIAGLGYSLWKKFQGDSGKALAALQSKKSQCEDDTCKEAVDKEIAKIKAKG